MEKRKFNIFKNIKSVKDVIRVIAYLFLFLLVSLCVYTFFAVDIAVKDKVVGIAGVPFVVDGKQITTVHTVNG